MTPKEALDIFKTKMNVIRKKRIVVLNTFDLKTTTAKKAQLKKKLLKYEK